MSTEYALELVGGLPRDQAEAVLLRVVVGLDGPAAARVLGKRPGAVRTAAYRGLKRLAKQLGVDKMVGTLEVGKDGDIAVFSAHPFAGNAMVEYTLVDGKVLFDRSEAATLRKQAATQGPGGNQ